jgi:hypothetical protein
MKLSKILIIFLLTNIIFINSCTSLKNAISGKKKPPGDEFLVKKKNPLVLPPEFGELPVPIKEELIKNVEELFKKNSIDKNSKSNTKKLSGSLEKSILKKINKN